MEAKKSKKQRVVHNALVDVDSVTTEPGECYINWIEITKQKLKEREQRLLQHKVNEIEKIMNATLTNNTDNACTLTLNQTIRNQTLSALNALILSWHGINITKVKHNSYSRFRDYFVRAKNWWDGTKKKVYGKVFWIVVFEYLRKVN